MLKRVVNDMNLLKDDDLPSFCTCDLCGSWIPLEQTILVSDYADDMSVLSCLKCLVYYIGSRLHGLLDYDEG